MINDIKLTSAMRNSLLNHQQIKDLTATVEKRLATGKKVNDILDGPVEYFKAKGLYDKADSLLKRKDDIDQAISTLKATQHGLTSGRVIIEQVKGLAEEARTASAAQRTVLEAQANKLLGEYNNLITDTHKDGTNLLVEEGIVATLDGVGDQVFLPPTGDIAETTVSAWVRTTKSSSEQILFVGTVPAGEQLRITTGGVLRGPDSTYGSIVINDGQWHHVAMTFDNATTPGSPEVRLYVDGVLDGQKSINPALATANVSWFARNSSVNYEGSVSDATVHTRAFSDAEVLNLKNGAIPALNLHGHWPFDDGAGTTVNDVSGNGNHGTIQNASIPSPFWDEVGAPGINNASEDLDVAFSDDSIHTIESVDIRTRSLGISTIDFSSTGLDATISSFDAALNRIDTTAASFATDFALLQTRLELTEDLINTHEEAGDKLTLADLEEESANRLALETREQLSIFSMTNSHQSIQNLIDILFGG